MVSVGSPWVVYGGLMGCPWAVRGVLVWWAVWCAWDVHEVLMRCLWIARRVPQDVRGAPMGRLLAVHGRIRATCRLRVD